MPQFHYKALHESGRTIEAKLQAKTIEEVAEMLRAKGLKILSIKKVALSPQIFSHRISTLDKANFCRYFSVMLRSGLSMAEALEVIGSETENSKLKQVLQELQLGMQQGGDISSILKKYPETFDKTFIALVQAGEQSGSLEKTFDYLGKQQFSVHRLNKKIQGAMMYPMVIFMAMGGVGFIMMTFVLPRLSQVFLKMKIPLPLPTRILLSFGNFMGKNALIVVAGAVVVVVLFIFIIRFYKTRRLIMGFIASLPIINKLSRQIDLARFSRTLATLLQSGVPIISALNITSETLSQKDLIEVAKSFEKGVSEGKPLASILTHGKKGFPALMIQTIKTGEKTGTLDAVLMEISDFYEAELEDMLKEFTTILEPVIMLIIGVAVGAMVLMVIAPIYSVLGNFQAMQK